MLGSTECKKTHIGYANAGLFNLGRLYAVSAGLGEVSPQPTDRMNYK